MVKLESLSQINSYNIFCIVDCMFIEWLLNFLSELRYKIYTDEEMNDLILSSVNNSAAVVICGRGV